jgi:hypothetical protein
MKLSNRAYNIMKFIAQIVIPAIGTLYYALAKIWKLPLAEEIVGTLTAIDAFLGALLGISTMRYNNSQNKPPETGTEDVIG